MFIQQADETFNIQSRWPFGGRHAIFSPLSAAMVGGWTRLGDPDFGLGYVELNR